MSKSDEYKTILLSPAAQLIMIPFKMGNVVRVETPFETMFNA
jgi:hypothetical protein